MSTDGDDEDDRVGYGRPPVANRFKKGVSGNPKGRPRKKPKPVPETQSTTSITNLILEEANRTVQVRENGRVTELPVLQAAIRSLGVVAMKGNHRATGELLMMARAAQEERDRIDHEFDRLIREAQRDWDYIFPRMQAAGEPLPLPHILDWKLDPVSKQWGVLGPVDEMGRDLDHVRYVLWDAVGNRLGRVLEARVRYPHGELYAEEYEAGEMLLKAMAGHFPLVHVRRRPDFNLERWKAENPGCPELFKKGIPSFGPMRQHLKDRYGDPPLARIGPECWWAPEWATNRVGGEFDFSELALLWVEAELRYSDPIRFAAPPKPMKRWPDP